jgi:4-hydroxy-tetrahydrodipicolinate reductase
VIAAGNFSVMAAVLRHAAAMAARHLGHWEIIDYASDTKPDVPSGTARDLAETLGQVREPGSVVPLDELEGPVEARGAEIGGARVHSVRLPSFVVSTEVVFGGPGERLIMRHDPGLTPAPYVAGTLLAVRRVADAVGVRRGLDSLLFRALGLATSRCTRASIVPPVSRLAPPDMGASNRLWIANPRRARRGSSRPRIR